MLLQSEEVQTPAGDDYEPVQDRSSGTVACVRACESVAAEKTASDYQHIVWAYGVIWSLFALYGVLLWRRATRQSVEVADLHRRLSKS